MSKKSDDSIERIFRQALTQYDTTFREDDWLKMEKMLNEEANRRAAARSKRIKGTAYTVTGLTGLIIAVYFLAFKTPSSSIAKLNNSSIELQATEDLRGSEGMNSAKDSAGLLSVPVAPDSLAARNTNSLDSRLDHAAKLKDGPSGLTPAIEQGRNEQTTNANNAKAESLEKLPLTSSKKQNGIRVPPLSSEVTKRENIRQPLTETSQSEASNVSAKQVPAYGEVNQDASAGLQNRSAKNGQSKDDAILNRQSTDNSADVDNDIVSADTNLTDSTQVASTGAQPAFNDIEGIQDSTQIIPSSISGTIDRDTLQAEALITRDEKTDSAKAADNRTAREEVSKPIFRWSVGVVFSPEFSTTSLNSYSAPGQSVGLRIGYQISNRFTISTGFIRSNKKYVGKGTDYSPRNPAYWQIRTNGVVPDEVDSRCLVYELPVGLQFDALQTQKSRLFLSAAISSYFMINQAYDYTFDTPNPGADTGWRSSGSESYWFNIGVVSAGYERYITRSFALGIEPYLKVSLAEIGWPEIKLFSTGAYVTLRYRFHERRDIE